MVTTRVLLGPDEQGVREVHCRLHEDILAIYVSMGNPYRDS